MADDYEVGYGKPPKQTRFRKGQSGNPSGGKKSRKSLGQLFDQLLHETVTVTEQGQKRRMTKLELAMSQLINKAISGDVKNMKIFLEVLGRFPPEATPTRLDRDDREFLAQFLAAANSLDDEV